MDLLEILQGKAFLSAASALAGALFWNFVALHRGRVRVLEYQVTHSPIGLTTGDMALGDVSISWRGTPVTSLFLSTLRLTNTTYSNLTDLKVKSYTGQPTYLLNERLRIEGSSYSVRRTVEYNALIAVPTGQQPTQLQADLYYHSREYLLPVLNRKQVFQATYLTTVMGGDDDGPTVWADVNASGFQVEFIPNEQQIHGVPVRWALPLGLVAAIALLVLLVQAPILSTWATASVCLIAGLAVQSIGALLYRVGRFLYAVVFQ